MRKWPIVTLFLGAAVLAMTTPACSVLSPQPDRSRYFVLVPVTNSEQASAPTIASQNASFVIGLGPISLPRYLQRPEVVTRVSSTEVSISPTDRWAEPLQSSVPRVLAEDLSNQSPAAQVVPFPWSRKAKVAYSVSVDFLRLEKTADGSAIIQATWIIRQGADGKLLQRGATTATLSAGPDQSSASAALSQGIAQLAREIAHALPIYRSEESAPRPAEF